MTDCFGWTPCGSIHRNVCGCPPNQLYHSVLTGNGTDEILKPLDVFTVDIGVGPSPIDHK